MDNIEFIEFQKKVIIKYPIQIYYINNESLIPFEKKLIKVRYHKKDNNLIMIALKDVFFQNISKEYSIKKRNISVNYRDEVNINNFHLNMIPTYIFLNDVTWVRNIKLKQLLNG